MEKIVAPGPVSPSPEANEPTATVAAERGAAPEPEDGMALCLSGGGYRAMLFHVGALWRLNEVGILRKLRRISSVSGGSIAAGALALGWKGLAFDAQGVGASFQQVLVDPIRRLARRTIDRGAILTGAALPFVEASDRVIAAYRKFLFGEATLQDLPDDKEGAPRFVLNASNVQSGVLWRFMKPYMRDYRVGEVRRPKISLAVAVAASSAFPPFLSPVELELDPDEFTPRSGTDLQQVPFTSQVVLTDGGVYDNLGIETCWKRFRTILVSDAGGALEPEGDPHRDWARHTYRILNLIDSQVRALRKRQVISSYLAGVRRGAYWGIRTNITDYALPDALPAPHPSTLELAATPTRLKALNDQLQERLINWGYAVCDAALRRYVLAAKPSEARFPYSIGV
jgi:NTE family protein